MTNLIVLAVFVITNTYPMYVSNPDPQATRANAFVATQGVCCVSTITDVGTDKGKYLFTVQSLDKDCTNELSKHRDGYVYSRKRKR